MSKGRNRKPISTTGQQHKKFIDKARELGCDENEAAFEDRLRQIVSKPKKEEAAPRHG